MNGSSSEFESGDKNLVTAAQGAVVSVKIRSSRSPICRVLIEGPLCWTSTLSVKIRIFGAQIIHAIGATAVAGPIPKDPDSWGKTSLLISRYLEGSRARESKTNDIVVFVRRSSRCAVCATRANYASRIILPAHRKSARAISDRVAVDRDIFCGDRNRTHDIVCVQSVENRG